MASYRFCRPDDIPVLVDMFNACYSIQIEKYPNLPLRNAPQTSDIFEQGMLEINLWPSYSMIAHASQTPVGILIISKRKESAFLQWLAVHPDHQHQGHGAHLLNSARQKMGVLGPHRIITMVPDSLPKLIDYFVGLGFTIENSYTDFVLQSSNSTTTQSEFVQEISVTDLSLENYRHDVDDFCWDRRKQSLLNRKHYIKGLAIPSVDGFTGILLFHTDSCDKEIIIDRLIIDPNMDSIVTIARILLQSLQNRTRASTYLFPQVRQNEIEKDLLLEIGFKEKNTWHGLVTKSIQQF